MTVFAVVGIILCLLVLVVSMALEWTGRVPWEVLVLIGLTASGSAFVISMMAGLYLTAVPSLLAFFVWMVAGPQFAVRKPEEKQ